MKLLFTILSCSLAATLLAQPTIVQSSGPTIGTILTEMATSDAANLDIGTAGANQNWNFTNLTTGFEQTVIEFVDPASLPEEYDGYFPDANLSIYFPDDSIAQFVISASDGIYIDGFLSTAGGVDPSEGSVDFDPNDLLFPYGITYNGTRDYQSGYTIEVDFGFPVRLTQTSTGMFLADGYGSVTTPAGTFNNVLRLKQTSTTVDSTFTDQDMDGTFEYLDNSAESSTLVTYQFLQNSAPVLVASFDMNEDETMVDYFAYYSDGATSIEESSALNYLSLSPNPAADKIRLQGLKVPTDYTIFDLTGKKIEQGRLGILDQDVDVNALKNGLYLIHLNNEEGERTLKFLVSH